MFGVQLPDSRVLSSALDSFNVAVAIVSSDSSILHVNNAARGMLAEGRNIVSRHGRLCGSSRVATDELWWAIGLTRGNGTAAAAGGIGVPLPGSNGDIATAHVAPLAYSDLGERPAATARGSATGVVFVVRADRHFDPDLAVIARGFRLTGAELRLLKRLLQGDTVMEAADFLNVAVSTARTHMKNLLAKTGTLRQTQLIALVHRLASPVQLGTGQLRLA
jgi:DNA-binding CsgD family transcriptional regulator